MRKLILINTVILLMLLGAAILPDYYINYSPYQSFVDSVARFEWLIFTGVAVAVILLSMLLALIPSKKMPYIYRLLSVNVFITTGFLFFVLYHAVIAIVDFRREYKVLSLKYKAMAETGIRNGIIIYETGGFEIPLDSAEQLKADKVDSLRRTYGISYSNTGCMTSAPILRAQGDYDQLVEVYLNKRNGEGWRNRMNRQIGKISAGEF